MRPIPKKLRDEMSRDPFYKRCCITGKSAPIVKIEWHHGFRYAGRQVNEKWCILPVSKEIHDKATDSEIRDKLTWIMLNRATDDELKKYSKAVDLIAMRKRLNKAYGSAKA